MLDKETDLTEAALHGFRKQFVGDTEKLLSFAVAIFFLKMGYTAEEQFVQTIA